MKLRYFASAVKGFIYAGDQAHPMDEELPDKPTDTAVWNPNTNQWEEPVPIEKPTTISADLMTIILDLEARIAAFEKRPARTKEQIEALTRG